MSEANEVQIEMLRGNRQFFEGAKCPTVSLYLSSSSITQKPFFVEPALLRMPFSLRLLIARSTVFSPMLSAFEISFCVINIFSRISANTCSSRASVPFGGITIEFLPPFLPPFLPSLAVEMAVETLSSSPFALASVVFSITIMPSEGRAQRVPEGSTWLSFGSFASLRMTPRRFKVLMLFFAQCLGGFAHLFLLLLNDSSCNADFNLASVLLHCSRVCGGMFNSLRAAERKAS